MKSRLLALPLVLAGVLSAQGPGPRGSSLTPPTPAEALQRQVDFLTKFYTLTTTPTNQVSDVQSILSAEQSCLATPAAQQTARDALMTAIKSWNPATTKTPPAAIGAFSSLEADQELCRATAAAGIWAILTTTQQMKGIGPLLGGGGRGGFRPGPPPKQ